MFDWLKKFNAKSNANSLEIGLTSTASLGNYGSIGTCGAPSLFSTIGKCTEQLKQKRVYTTQLDEFCFAVADHLADVWGLKICKKACAQDLTDEEQRETVIAASAVIIKESIVAGDAEQELKEMFNGIQVSELDLTTYCNKVRALSEVDAFKQPIAAFDITYLTTIQTRINRLNTNDNYLRLALFVVLNECKRIKNSSP